MYAISNTPSINLVATGENIRSMRRERGITVRDIAEHMGFTTEQPIYKWQRGQCLPSIDNLIILCRMFSCYIEDILVIDDDEMSSRFI